MDKAAAGTRTTLGDVSGRAITLARCKVIEQAENTLQLNDHLPVSAITLPGGFINIVYWPNPDLPEEIPG